MHLIQKNGAKPMILSREPSTESSRLEALKARHLAISNEIKEDSKHPAVDDLMLRSKKLKRLKLKDEILLIRQSS